LPLFFSHNSQRKKFQKNKKDLTWSSLTFLAWRRGAVICLDLTAQSNKAERTVTFVAGQAVEAGATIEARVGGALIDVDLAELACVALATLTLVAGLVARVNARAPVLAEALATRAQAHLTATTIVAIGTLTLVDAERWR